MLDIKTKLRIRQENQIFFPKRRKRAKRRKKMRRRRKKRRKRGKMRRRRMMKKRRVFKISKTFSNAESAYCKKKKHVIHLAINTSL